MRCDASRFLARVDDDLALAPLEVLAPVTGSAHADELRRLVL
jgi:hypothetical protein